MSLLQGVIPILPTPFIADGGVDESGLQRVADWLIDHGVHGLGTLGLASEAPKLSEEERDRVLRAVVKGARGRVPVVAGIYHEATCVAIRQSSAAVAGGADALMLFPPVLGKVGTRQLIDHLSGIARSVGVPVIIQDTPQVRGAALTLAEYSQLLEAAPNVKYAKIEAVPAGQAMQAVLESLGDRIDILAGWGGLEFMDALRRGACGCMPGADVAPGLVAVYAAFCDHQPEQAQALFDRLQPLIAFSSLSLDRFICVAKTLLAHQGLIACADLRPPFSPFDPVERQEMDRLLRSSGMY